MGMSNQLQDIWTVYLNIQYVETDHAVLLLSTYVYETCSLRFHLCTIKL